VDVAVVRDERRVRGRLERELVGQHAERARGSKSSR
jgi:hypothetical protein